MHIMPRPGLALDHIGRQPVAVGHIGDVHSLTGQHSGGLQRHAVDRHPGDVVRVGLGDCHPMELGVEQICVAQR